MQSPPLHNFVCYGHTKLIWWDNVQIGVLKLDPSEGTCSFFLNSRRTHFSWKMLLLPLKEHTSNSDTHRGRISFLWRSESHSALERQLQALCYRPQSKHLPYHSLTPVSLVVTWIPSFAAKTTPKLYTFKKGNLQDLGSQRGQDEEGSFFKTNYTQLRN